MKVSIHRLGIKTPDPSPSPYSVETQILPTCGQYLYTYNDKDTWVPFITSKFLVDAQIDVQDVPVDSKPLIRRLAVLLIYQCMSVPTSGTTILSGYHLTSQMMF